MSDGQRKRKPPTEVLMMAKQCRSRRLPLPSKTPKRNIMVSLSKKTQENEIKATIQEQPLAAQEAQEAQEQPLAAQEAQEAQEQQLAAQEAQEAQEQPSAAQEAQEEAQKAWEEQQRETSVEDENTLVLNALEMSPPRTPSPPPLFQQVQEAKKTRMIILKKKLPSTSLQITVNNNTQEENMEKEGPTSSVQQAKKVQRRKPSHSPSSSTSSSSSSSESSSDSDRSRSRSRTRSHNKRHKKTQTTKRKFLSDNNIPENATVAEALGILLDPVHVPETDKRHKSSSSLHNFTVIEKEFKLQSVVIIGKGLEKVAGAALKKEGYLFFNYRKVFDMAALQIVKTHTEVVAKSLEGMLSLSTLFIKFYHWARTQTAFAKLAIIGLTSGSTCQQSIKKLTMLGALYIQSWPQSVCNLPQTFRWKDKPAEVLWIAHSETSSGVANNSVMPRDGWSKGGVNMLVILLGNVSSDVQTLVDCGCYVYNEMWRYETIATSMLKYGGVEPNAFSDFANHLRKKTATFPGNNMQVISRFADWWETKSVHNKARQVVLYGLDAVCDAVEIEKFQKMGALVFARNGSLTACDVDIDRAYENEQDLMERFKKLFRAGEHSFHLKH